MRKVLSEATEAAKVRISMAMLNSAALRISMELELLQIVTLGLEGNKGHSVSVLLLKATDLGLIMWGIRQQRYFAEHLSKGTVLYVLDV